MRREETYEDEDDMDTPVKRRRRAKNNLESIIQEINTPKEKKFEIRNVKVQLFGYHTYKLRKTWSEHVLRVKKIEHLVYLVYIYGLNLLHFVSARLERKEKKNEVERNDDLPDSLLKYQKKSEDKLRERLRPLGNAMDSKSETVNKHRYKFRKAVLDLEKTPTLCYVCEDRCDSVEEIQKCCSCEVEIHKECLDQEDGPVEIRSDFRCSQCIEKISTRRFTRNFKKQMNLDFV